MRAQFVSTASKIIESDRNVALLLGDIGVFGFRNTMAKYPKRVYNIGILEQSTISLAAGLSIGGIVPIVHTIAPFIVERALEQIKIDLCYQKLGSNLISVGASYDYASLGCTHHCPADIPTLNQIPGIELLVPGHEKEFHGLLCNNYNNGNTTYYRLSEHQNAKALDVQIGKNNLVQEKGNTIVIVVGPLLDVVIEASEGLEITIIYCTTVKPFDIDFIKQFPKMRRIIVIEPYYCGPILQNILGELKYLDFPLEMIGVENRFIEKYGRKDQIDSLLGLTVAGIRERLKNAIN